MPFLDMKTILLSNYIINVVMTLVIYWIWRQNRKRLDGLSHCLAVYILQTIGQVLLYTRGISPDFVSIVVSNSLFITSLVILLLGISRFVEVKVYKTPNFVLIAIFFILYLIFGLVKPSLLIRILILSISFVMVIAQIVWILLWKIDKRQRRTYRAAGLIFLIFCFFYVIRIINLFINPPGEDFWASNVIESIMLIVTQMFSLALTFILILIIYGRLFLKNKPIRR
jgi:hypothetical protein